MHIFPLTFAFYPFRVFWCELLSFGAIGCRDVCLPSTIMELDRTLLVVLKAPPPQKNKTFERPRSHDLVTAQILLSAV